MTHLKKFGLGSSGLAVLVAGLLFIAGHSLTRDSRERRAQWQPLLATHAPLSAITQHAGHITVWRRGTPDWDQVLAHCKRGSKWDHHVAAKMESASAVGHISTIDMDTWIFLDEHDRLVDFALGTQ
jgi:hypothetical protein